MKYTVVFEQLGDPDFPAGYYDAHIPSLDLTTHGSGIEGAREAALDLLKAWIEEKKANGEDLPAEGTTLYSTLEIEDALLGT